MPVRTGEQYLAGLRDQPREIHHRGQKVEDVTAFPGLANGARSIAGLYDMQHDPNIRDEMTYTSPTTGDPVGLCKSSRFLGAMKERPTGSLVVGEV